MVYSVLYYAPPFTFTTSDTEITPTPVSKEAPAANTSPANATKAKETSKVKKAAAAKPVHPKYANMITAAIRALKECGSSSRIAFGKYILGTTKVMDVKKAESLSICAIGMNII